MKQVFVVDTNVLLRYFHSDDKQQTQLVTPYFENPNHQLVITSEVLCELYWVLKKTMKVDNMVILSIMLTLLNLPNIHIVNAPAVKFALNFLQANGDFADGIIAYQATQFDKARLLTFDKKAQKIAQNHNVLIENPAS
ncbi:hypothetical protein B0181_10860 [Moraxella caviae]|uniref:Predicted nucleic acid-binding protein, contains PIN domain n=1 Tax=Moraxella caviae TaxID=34060 RepID=A0A1S9ZUN5_9GAMM|nr:type II toxin-antitoxin system VapC family toxin [Moraxella caviae]OOR87212.1 hypothetical protein B0181_10860 [Moraxella caviae]STZ09925.1 Predicted nucleic acid-binding protein, contains PIN domain [Moraxella caviae]